MTVVSNRSFYVEQVNDVTVVCFTVSALVEANYEFVSDELFDLVEQVTSSGPIQVVVDLGSIRNIDDWGLAMLRAFHETIENHGGMAILCRITQRVMQVVAESGLNNSFHLCDTRREAVWSFSDVPAHT